MISIRRRISFLKSTVETFLGKLENKGLGCMVNPYDLSCLYFNQFYFFAQAWKPKFSREWELVGVMFDTLETNP